jgi:hypothetical protein
LSASAEQAEGGAIALGGGNVMSEQVRRRSSAMSSFGCRSIIAEAVPDCRGDRPLAANAADVERLHEQRRYTPRWRMRSCRAATGGDHAQCPRSRSWLSFRRNRALGGKCLQAVPGLRGPGLLGSAP